MPDNDEIFLLIMLILQIEIFYKLSKIGHFY